MNFFFASGGFRSKKYQNFIFCTQSVAIETTGCIQTLMSEWQKLIFLWNCAKWNFNSLISKYQISLSIFCMTKTHKTHSYSKFFCKSAYEIRKKVIYVTWQKVIYKSEYGHSSHYNYHIMVYSASQINIIRITS